jgi:O-antigen/teichoic acid export membrane protein
MRVAGNAAGIVVGLGTATLLLRHLGVAESGRYVTVMSLVAIAGSVASWLCAGRQTVQL